MGWFNWISKVIDPVVNAAEKVTEAFVQTVIEPLSNVITSIWDGVTATVDKIVEVVTDAVGSVIDTSSEVAIEAAFEIIETAFDNGFVPDNPDLSRFEPVVPEAEQVQSVTIDSADWTETETIEIRDAVVAAQIGYADYSDLLAVGAVDIDGYVIDSGVLYEQAGWLDGIVDWASERFDIIRVLEDASSSLLAGFEANVTLLQNNVCLLYTSPSPRDKRQSRMPSSA